ITFTLIQQFEALFIVPLVMKRAVDVDPIVVILAIIAGLNLGSVLGAILSIPIVVIIKIIINELNETRKKQEEKEKLEKVDNVLNNALIRRFIESEDKKGTAPK